MGKVKIFSVRYLDFFILPYYNAEESKTLTESAKSISGMQRKPPRLKAVFPPDGAFRFRVGRVTGSPARFFRVKEAERAAKAVELGGTAWNVPRPKDGAGAFFAAKGTALITKQT